MTYILVGIGCIIGNITWALFTGEWGSAVERSFFQIVAILTLWFVKG